MRRALSAVVLLLAVALLGGCATRQPAPAVPPPPATTSAQAGLPPAEPAAIDIPRIGAHSSLVPLGLNPDHTVDVPPVSEPQQAGWYRFGSTPGEVGPAVILGHVDGNKQLGIFYRLKELVPGDRVSVSRVDGSTARFVVSRVEQADKDVFPSGAVYDDTADPELRLITCGGSFDHAAHSYRDNIIVFAVFEGAEG
ncbi:class F sortase [Amycolatopsis acidiphila]|uniref:Class F sortase n=1 Tax=Amycolatopsis acidiphila TaxID=715473 RepID=A0A558A453_9PSEU|nr:class F sortase [Amycolatopsis acidiphila]TVT19054.1 class F sortase [Amycolatopsis acidiphila]UIJ63702.1 class F sortase [Amycolatopsis acidiphila]GHG67357.1 hypothetical protein GCM10017788_26190 [Amycolatopsis acidiphila]